MRRFLTLTAAVSLCLCALNGAAWAEGWTDKLEFSGYLSSDIRYQIEDHRGAKDGEGFGFEMNRNDVNFRLSILPYEKVQAVIDTRLRFYGFNESADIPQMVRRNKIDPWDFYLDEAYLNIKGMIWDKLDLKIGRMAQTWGTADQFNPTDNLNARDFSDPLDYSSKVPNEMVEIDIFPADWVYLKLVWVPLFKPSQLPPSAALAFNIETLDNGEIYFPAPPISKQETKNLISFFTDPVNAKELFGGAQLNLMKPEVRAVMPKTDIQNSQAAAKLGFHLGGVDFSFSYYYGRFTFPVAYTAVADVILPYSDATPHGVTDKGELDPKKVNVKYIAEILYPRMHVAGFDFAYSAPWLFDLGIVGEVAVFMPEQVDFGMRFYVNGQRGDLDPTIRDVLVKNGLKGEYRKINVPRDPFVKATVGLDYTFTSWLYANAMYVRGFFDEFNDAYGLHNYFVAATEFSFLESEFKIRLSTVLNCDDLSAVFYPELTWIVYPSVELKGGVFYYFGDTRPTGDDRYDYAAKSRFGQKAAGRSVAFLKAKVNW